MSDFVSHVAAIGIGVAITLYLVGGFNNNNNGDATSDAKKGGKGSSNSNSNGSANNAGPKKRNRKKTKKKAAPAKAAAAAAVVAEKQTAKVQAPVVEPAPVAKEPEAAVLVPKATATATASATATATPTATPTPTPATGGKKNKKKKNKKQPAAAVAAANPAPVAVAAPTPAATPTAPVVVPLQPRTEREEEAWATIPSKSKKKKTAAQKKQQAALAAASLAASGAAAAASLTVTIDASRVGIVIGPRGATMNSIQEKTGTKLDVNAPAKPEDGGGASAGASAASNGQFRPVVNGSSSNKAKATVVVSEGTPEMQQVAKRAVLELADRGYATLLQAEGFGESSVSVHPRFLSEIVGSQGKTIKAIQTALDVKLTIPKTEWSPKQPQIGNSEPSCRIGIAGDLPANVKTAKQVIRDLCQYHHHEITHPGFVHQEVNVPTEFFHCVIGTRGSEIKHIRGNYKVEVYMPSNESWCTTDNVLCVGKSNDVEKAINYIKLLMERDTELREQKYSDEHFGDDAEGW